MGRKPDNTPPSKIKLVDLPRQLKAHGLSVPYNQCYSAAVNGTIPAERTASGSRWVIDEREMPSLIKQFSLLKED